MRASIFDAVVNIMLQMRFVEDSDIVKTDVTNEGDLNSCKLSLSST